MRLALALLLALAAAAPATAQVSTIYSSLPSRGPAADQAKAAERGMSMAFEEAAIPTLRYVALDASRPDTEDWDPRQVSENARRAAQDATSVAYLGEFNSTATMVSLPILNEAGLLQISPSNAYVGLTRAGAGAQPGDPDRYYPTGIRTFGRIVPADHVQARALIEYARVRRRKRVVIVHDGGVYGGGIARMARASAANAGVRVVGFARVRRGNVVATARLVRRRRPAAMVFCGGVDYNAAPLWRAVHRRNPRIDLIACDGVTNQRFADGIGRRATSRTFFTAPPLAETAYPKAGQDFHERFRRKYEQEPEEYAIYGYEAMSLAIDSLARGGATREGVIAAFFATRDRPSVLGTYSIDAFGDTTLLAFGGYRIARGAPAFDRVLLRP